MWINRWKWIEILQRIKSNWPIFKKWPIFKNDQNWPISKNDQNWSISKNDQNWPISKNDQKLTNFQKWPKIDQFPKMTNFLKKWPIFKNDQNRPKWPKFVYWSLSKRQWKCELIDGNGLIFCSESSRVLQRRSSGDRGTKVTVWTGSDRASTVQDTNRIFGCPKGPNCPSSGRTTSKLPDCSSRTGRCRAFQHPISCPDLLLLFYIFFLNFINFLSIFLRFFKLLKINFYIF